MLVRQMNEGGSIVQLNILFNISAPRFIAKRLALSGFFCVSSRAAKMGALRQNSHPLRRRKLLLEQWTICCSGDKIRDDILGGYALNTASSRVWEVIA